MTEEKPTKKKTSIGIAVIAAILASSAVNIYFDSRSNGKPSESKINSALVQSANEINKNLPMIIDSATRMDATMALPGRVFMYTYTIIGLNKDEFDEQAFVQAMKPSLINSYKTLDEMKTFRDLNVEMRYVYKAEDGSALAKISISPADF